MISTRSNRFNFFTALILLIVQQAVGQMATGKVVDENGLPFPGVLVLNTQTNVAVETSIDGAFSIQSSPNTPLKFSYLGAETKIVKFTESFMTIQLTPVSNNLEEVVIVGYGAKKKGAITGSVVQIKSDELLKMPAQSAIQAIQGKAAGVNIVTNDEPGAAPTIIIRGLGTVLGGRSPLYIIDGAETNGLNGISPNDINTIDILKDAASLAIYGQKGSNGVVLITTKKGAKGKLKVTLESYIGLKTIQKKVKLSNAYRYVYYNNVALGSSSYFNFDQPVDTDWLDEITGNGEVTNTAVSLSGGNESSNYYFGASNYTEKGILNGTEFKRTNLVSKNEFKFLENKIKVTQFINMSITGNTPKPLSAFTSAYKQAPIMPVYNATGRFAVPLLNAQGINDIDGIRYNNVSNPAADLFFANQQNKGLNLFGSVAVELKLTSDLLFNSNFGATYDQNKGYSFSAMRDIWLHQNPTKQLTDYPTPNRINSLSIFRSDSYIWNFDNYLTYKKAFGKHDITALVGMSRTTNNNFESFSATRYNVPEQSNYWYLNFSTNNEEIDPGSVVNNFHSTPSVSLAYFTRVEYEFNKKYLFTALVRREGISIFKANNRWDNFPSVSAGWVLSNEEFFQKIKSITYLKLRGGYGIVGNGRGTPSVNTLLFGSGYNYALGNGQVINPGSSIPYQIDENLTWEKMKEIDLGFDFKMLDNKLSGSFDFYNRKSDKVILPVNYPASLSPGQVYVNAGEVTNKGMELSLSWRKEINKNWSYFVEGNIAINNNTLSSVYNPFFQNLIGGSLNNGINVKQVVEGESLGSFYVYQVTGLNADGGFTYSDQKIIAGSYLPTYTYGFNFGFNYKRFDFSVYTYGVGGNKIYNGKKAQRFGGENIEHALLTNFWTPSNTNAANPKPFNDIPLASTFYLEDGAYWRINNITLGYNVPSFTDKIAKMRVYFTATNPFIFTKYSGYSPEITGDPLGGAGIELDAYPTNKSFVFGLNLSL